MKGKVKIMIYRVTEKYYESLREETFDYVALLEAKKHVDNFYMDRSDSGDQCTIKQIAYESEIEYNSPWENKEFKSLMKKSKEALVRIILKRKKRKVKQ